MAAASRTDDAARAMRGRWANDPVLFAREVLGVTPWWRQEEMLRAVVEHRRVAVKAGQKVSKSCTAAILAYWFALTRRDAVVVCSSSSYGQLRRVIWLELRKRREATMRMVKGPDGQLVRAAGIAPLGGIFHDDPETGILFSNGSRIIGIATDDPTRAAGVSGAEMLYVLDESTGIPDEIFEAIDGNTASDGRIFAISNPTSTSGWFYDAFGPGSSWHQITISSEEAAAVTPRIPGLATKEFLEQKAQPSEWGRGSSIWSVRVLGEFPQLGSDGVISLDLVSKAESRWTPTPQEDGPLQIGVDVAGEGTDSTCIIWSRGNWTSEPIVMRNAPTPEIVKTVVQLCRDLRRPGEKASVRIDKTSIGHGAYGYLQLETELMDVVGIESHSSSPDPTCWRMRDAVWLSLRKWMATGAIAKSDRRLREDLLAPRLETAPDGRFRIEPKPALRKRLRRSTDRADALALSVFEVETDVWDPAVFDISTR
jgi:hypothetical protein